MADPDVSNLRFYRANLTFRDVVKDVVYELDPSAWSEYIDAEFFTEVDPKTEEIPPSRDPIGNPTDAPEVVTLTAPAGVVEEPAGQPSGG